MHGALWIIELMAEHSTSPTATLLEALDCLDQDELVRLPRAALRALKLRIAAWDALKSVSIR